jgi:phage gp16-like protein
MTRIRTCKACGEPRCEWVDVALCYECWCAYHARASWVRYHRKHPNAKPHKRAQEKYGAA